jgi:hypothetical protein
MACFTPISASNFIFCKPCRAAALGLATSPLFFMEARESPA